MTMFERDPDVARWGLYDLIDVCSISNAGSCQSITYWDVDSSEVGCVREGYHVPKWPNVENDEAIAHVLQEEFKRLADEEVSTCPNNFEEKASVLAQDWCGHSGNHCSAEGHGNIQQTEEAVEPRDDFNKMRREEADEMGVSSICSSPAEGLLSSDDMLHSVNITDECPLDGEVGKRLNRMISVPHVPKINGDIPTADEEISDHQRLLERLQLYGLVELKIQGDGNCQFRSLSDQLYRSPEHHKFVREQVVNQLRSHPNMYEGYVPMAYSDYVSKMSRSGEWGDHVTLQAASDWYGVKIFVITSFKDTCYIEISPHVEKSGRLICLSFWAEVHYNSIYPEGDLHLLETRRKKKWWKLGS